MKTILWVVSYGKKISKFSDKQCAIDYYKEKREIYKKVEVFMEVTTVTKEKLNWDWDYEGKMSKFYETIEE